MSNLWSLLMNGFLGPLTRLSVMEIFMRGATDDKGQVLTHIQSVCGWLSTQNPLLSDQVFDRG